MTSTLNQRIQQFYDTSSGLWEQIWGEHMHHGFYGADGKAKKERRQAQIDLIEALLDWANVQQPRQILDVGCGIGGSTLYLADKYQAHATGITLSPVQAERAQERARKFGMDRVSGIGCRVSGDRRDGGEAGDRGDGGDGGINFLLAFPFFPILLILPTFPILSLSLYPIPGR